MVSSKPPKLIEYYITENIPGGEVLRFTIQQKSYHSAALQLLQSEEHLPSCREYGLFRELAKGKGKSREAHHLGEIVLYGWVGNLAVSRVVSLADDPGLLYAISQAGYAAHMYNPFRELTYDLASKTTGDVVAKVISRRDQGINRQVFLPAEKKTVIQLNDARDHEGLLALLGTDGLNGFVADLESVHPKVPYTYYESLTKEDLILAGVTPESGLVLVRSSVAGDGKSGIGVSACGQFNKYKHVLLVTVINPRRSTTGTE